MIQSPESQPSLVPAEVGLPILAMMEARVTRQREATSASPLLLDEIGEPLTDADGMGHRAVYVKPTRQYPYDNVSALHDDWFGGEREAYLHLPVVVDSPAVKAWAKSNEQGSTDESVGDDPLAGIWQRELAGKLGEALANIPPDQAAVLRMRAGMNQAARPHTMREVGDLLSVSVVEVQRRENGGVLCCVTPHVVLDFMPILVELSRRPSLLRRWLNQSVTACCLSILLSRLSTNSYCLRVVITLMQRLLPVRLLTP